MNTLEAISTVALIAFSIGAVGYGIDMYMYFSQRGPYRTCRHEWVVRGKCHNCRKCGKVREV